MEQDFNWFRVSSHDYEFSYASVQGLGCCTQNPKAS